MGLRMIQKLKLVILTFIVALNISFAQEVNIKILAATIGSNESDTLFITGNLSELGFWNPGAVKMVKNEEGFYEIDLIVKQGTQIEYKFTLGSWQSEALNKEGFPFPNFTLKALNDTALYYNFEKFGGQGVFSGGITGTLEYIRGVESGNPVIPSRDVSVLLPEGYYDSNERYPVFYMHDGQNIFDPATSSFGIDWQVDESIDSLSKEGDIPKMIVVGINNSTYRRAEYHNSDTGYAYMNFLVNVVKPLIDSVYRTKPEREFTGTGGSSMGGLISFILAWEFDHIFSKAACLSPAFKISRFDYVSTVLNYTGDKKKIKLYIDNGGVGLEAQLQPGIDEMIEALKMQGFEEGKDFYYLVEPDAEHNEPAWAKRNHLYLKFLFGVNN